MNINTQKFLELFDDFEKYFNSLLNINIDEAKPFWVWLNNLLWERPVWSSDILKNIDKLWEISRIRNTIQHNPWVYEISDESLRKIETLHSIIFHPPKVRDIFPQKPVFCTNPDENLEKILFLMKEKNYTHIPVYEWKNFLGVISDWTLLNFFTQNENINLKNFFVKDLVFQSKYKYYFVSQNLAISELEKMFSDASEKNEKIGAILVTNLWKPDEQLLTIITPWDFWEIDEYQINIFSQKNIQPHGVEKPTKNIVVKLKNWPKFI